MKKKIAKALLLLQLLLLIALVCLLSAWNAEIDFKPFAIVMPITALMILFIYKQIKTKYKFVLGAFAVAMSVFGVWASLADNRVVLPYHVIATALCMVVAEICTNDVRDLPTSKFLKSLKQKAEKAMSRFKENRPTLGQRVSQLQTRVDGMSIQKPK